MCTCQACFVPHLPHPAGLILPPAPRHIRGSFWNPLLPSISHPVPESRQFCLQNIPSLCHPPMWHLRWPLLWAPCFSLLLPWPHFTEQREASNPFVGSPAVCSELPKGSHHKALIPQPLQECLLLVPTCLLHSATPRLGSPLKYASCGPRGLTVPSARRLCPQVLAGLSFSTQLPTVTPPPPRSLP